METISFVCYDTVCSIQIVPPRPGTGGPLLRAGERLARQVEQTLNMYDPHSELSLMCAGYRPSEPWPLSDMLFDFLQINLDFAAKTRGAFDPTVGALTKLWHFTQDAPHVPEEQTLRGALARVGYEHIRLSGEPAAVFDRPGIQLDPGASGKGYALGLVRDQLAAAGVEQGVLDFGGNLCILGGKPAPKDQPGEPWRVALKDPAAPGDVLGWLELADCSVATSSWYEHGFRRDGVLYHHLLDPATGMPHPLDLSSVSVVSSHAVYTDLLSTAFFLLGLEEGRRLAALLRETSGIDVEYVAALTDGEIICSGGVSFHPLKNRT